METSTEIPPAIRAAATKLIARLERTGTLSLPEQFRELCEHPLGTVPHWLVQLMTEFPLAGIQIGVKVTDEFAGLRDEPVLFEWGDAALMQELNLASYPGRYLFPRGYLALGCGV